MRVPGIDFRTGIPADLAALREVDDDASLLFERAGLELDLPKDHEFVVAERERWQRCLDAGTTILATDGHRRVVGFVAVCLMDTEPFLAQLSVRLEYTRRGIGGALLHAAIDSLTAGHAALWLTTYDHLPWNLPWYERRGFVRIDERDCGEELRRELALERRSLPLAERRVAMRRPLSARVPR